MITFTQYLRPDGRPIPITIERPSDIENKAQAIVRIGFFFEAEVLTTGQVSLTVADRENERDLAIRVVPNGPQVVTAVDSLVEEVYRNFISSQ